MPTDTTVDVTEPTARSDFERMELRSLVKLASEPISHFWPMQTFIHHNPLHGLEHLAFHDAVARGKQLLGGSGYLPNDQYRAYYRQGRISDQAITEALGPIAQNEILAIGDQNISHLTILRTLLISGTGHVAPDVALAALEQMSDERSMDALVNALRLRVTEHEFPLALSDAAKADEEALGSTLTLGRWCDQTFGTTVQEQMNHELIKWCAGFLDEGHAPWPMPLRQHTFYGAWKTLAQEDSLGMLWGIDDWPKNVGRLPDRPDDAILECLTKLAIPKPLWTEYFTLHLAQMSGWTGFIKWRSEQAEHEWQQAFPIDIVSYMAVRLMYEQVLVEKVCREKLGIPGAEPSIRAFLREHAMGYGLYKEWHKGRLPPELSADLAPSLFIADRLPINDLDRTAHDLHTAWQTARREQTIATHALSCRHVAQQLEVSIDDLLASTPDTLNRFVGWITSFPESSHGPSWLHAFERSYLTGFVQHISPNLEKLRQSDAQEDTPPDSRPLTQGIFCIDVRSEGFRRHFEEVGGNETLGFAGFFGVPLCYQGFGSEQETDQCPVLLKPKHVIKEVPRAYQGAAAERFIERQRLAKTGHTLLHDLKEHVITPYVMVEAIGWFFGFRLFGQTLAPGWFHKVVSWFKERVGTSIGTTLTVEKLTHDEAEEMVASQHRASIYRMLIERFGREGMNVSHDHVERLRRQALHLLPRDEGEDEELRRQLRWTSDDHAQCLRDLQQDYDVHERAATHRMHRITQTGFTTTEQAHFVETALRILGFTKSFARLILICAHGSESDNNPYESALDCGACGGNHGVSNARAFAAMANKAQVRQLLAQKGIHIPQDTHFLPGQHNTTTDAVELFDLVDVPSTHRKDLRRLQRDLETAGRHNSRERLARFPDESDAPSAVIAFTKTQQRSVDWSQVRPEWGLSRHTAFIVGRRQLTQGINLGGRTFLHSYDYLQDPTGKYLEIIMTAPLIVGNWINMEHYFSTVDPSVYGAGSKVYHNVVSRVGVMYGSESDLCIGLPTQTVLAGDEPYHEPMRLFAIIEAPLETISTIVDRHEILKRLVYNQWINLIGLDTVSADFFLHDASEHWQRLS